MIRTPLAAIFALALAATPLPAFAWGATGHELVSGAAIDALSKDVPAFLRTRAARDQIALIGREPDRWRGSGKVHDYDRDSAHFIDLGDDGTIGGVTLDALPVSRSEYEATMHDKGIKPGSYGYLPYAMIDGYQQMVKDFAYWRASKVAATNARTKADRDWFAADMKLREMLILRDVGVWSHYVGDGSQPQHVTQHHAGWDAYPDPMTYPPPGQPPEIRTVHNYFEGPFVKMNVQLAAVRQAMTPYTPCACAIEPRVSAYLKTTWARLKPLYELVASGDIKNTTPKAVAFATARIAAGASEVRNEIEDAWKASATAVVGYPGIDVADIESRKAILSRLSYGAD
jgi:hypothetical protein